MVPARLLVAGDPAEFGRAAHEALALAAQRQDELVAGHLQSEGRGLLVTDKAEEEEARQLLVVSSSCVAASLPQPGDSAAWAPAPAPTPAPAAAAAESSAEDDEMEGGAGGG